MTWEKSVGVSRGILLLCTDWGRSAKQRRILAGWTDEATRYDPARGAVDANPDAKGRCPRPRDVRLGYLAPDPAQAPQDDPEAGAQARADDREACGRVSAPAAALAPKRALRGRSGLARAGARSGSPRSGSRATGGRHSGAGRPPEGSPPAGGESPATDPCSGAPLAPRRPRRARDRTRQGPSSPRPGTDRAARRAR